MSQIATEFLTRCFATGETIALLLRNENADRPAQRIVRLEQALAPAYMRWLVHENHAGANVYIAANPLRSGSRRRTKDCIASVRHLYIDIDSDGDARLAALRASDAVPSPTVILSTSPDKYQALWRVDGFDFEQQEAKLKQLAIAFGGDLACTDCNRVLRIPGFLNQKYSPAPRVTVEYPCDTTWKPESFRLHDAVASGMPAHRASLKVSAPSKNSHSEQDWSWVLEALLRGETAEELTRKLATRRADKPNPLYYAQRTVDMASARIWLLKGAPINDVVTMLVARHEHELSAVVCNSRAREIATTAQRMIARSKTV